LKYYWEYELSQGNLLDFRVMFEKLPEFRIKVGQWKTYYNRERVISSGKQLLVDRSIITRPFTIDRQLGVSFYGRMFPGSLADLTCHLSLLTGTGRGEVKIPDKINGGTTRLLGSYFQAGYFFSNLWSAVPQPLELAARYARYIPNSNQPELREEEFTLAFNWFFKGGNRNKLTAEITVFDFQTSMDIVEDTTRCRIQWDISF
jgi:hypothetical protein